MTFSALNTLVTLGDDLERVNKKTILESLKVLQLADGRYLFFIKNFVSV